MSPPASRADCEACDAHDPLARIRDQFRVKPGVIYLDGNSLGALTHDSVARARTMMRTMSAKLSR